MGHLSSAKEAMADLDRKVASLEGAERSLKMAGVDDNALVNIASQKQLLLVQKELERTHQHLNFINKPLKTTLEMLIPIDQATADKIARELKVNIIVNLLEARIYF